MPSSSPPLQHAGPTDRFEQHLRERVPVVLPVRELVVRGPIGRGAAARLRELRHAVGDRRRAAWQLIRVRAAAVRPHVGRRVQIPAGKLACYWSSPRLWQTFACGMDGMVWHYTGP